MRKPFPEGDNPRDPLKQTGPEAQLELLHRFGQVSNGFPLEVVIGATINLLMNSIRQSHITRAGAERRFDELFNRFKSVLLSHYDAVTGKRRSIFPFPQTINVGHFNNRNVHHKPQ